MSIFVWRVFFTKRRLPQPRAVLPLVGELRDLDRWLDERELLDDAPFLLGPDGSYDVALNGYLTGTWLRGSPKNTQAAVAYDLKKWLEFLASSRDRPTWRDATAEDRAAFEQWRRKDPRGPRIASTTWDREVATVNGFYQWAVRQGHVAWNPLLQRPSRARRRSVNEPAAQTPAEASHLGPRRDLKWLTPAMYRSWRDVGVRGFASDGLPDRSFRGRYASRNAAFTDMLIRTGLRISEQVALSLFELPELTHAVVNARTWLPNAVAKNGSGRAIYIPAAVLKDVWDYIEMERADAVAAARAVGLYDRIHDPLIVEDPQRDRVRVGQQRVRVASSTRTSGDACWCEPTTAWSRRRCG